MTSIIFDLIGKESLSILFVSSFILGLLILLLLIFTSSRKTKHHSSDDHHDSKDHHHDHSGLINDHNGITNNNIQYSDLDFDLLDQYKNKQIDFQEIFVGESNIPNSNNLIYEEVKFPIGIFAVFLFVFGQIGILVLETRSDFMILLALIGGVFSSFVFNLILSNYIQPTIVPILHVKRGDIGRVVYGLTPDKPGIVQVYRKDGVISTVIARGEFPHDNFLADELGYIWNSSDKVYTITRGVKQEKDLKRVKKKKFT